MINGKRVLAYIPARSGSKGIKDKNIVDVCGKPLIAHTIEAAKLSKYVDKVIVSTDSPRYAEIARTWGAETPFPEPTELATDTSIEMDNTIYIINWLEQHAQKFDIIMRLQCTSPLRITEDIDRGLELLEKKQADSVISVTEAAVPPFWMNTLPEDGSMGSFIREEVKRKTRQEFPQYYQLNGAVFIADWNFIKNSQSWYGEKSYALIMPAERSVDIDNPLDLEFVQFLMEKKLKEGKSSS